MKCAIFCLLALCAFQTDFAGGEDKETPHQKAFKQFKASDDILKNNCKRAAEAVAPKTWTKAKIATALGICTKKEHDKKDWKEKYCAGMNYAEELMKSSSKEAGGKIEPIISNFATKTNKPSYDQALICFGQFVKHNSN